jgi:hypothetical protein
MKRQHDFRRPRAPIAVANVQLTTSSTVSSASEVDQSGVWKPPIEQSQGWQSGRCGSERRPMAATTPMKILARFCRYDPVMAPEALHERDRRHQGDVVLRHERRVAVCRSGRRSPAGPATGGSCRGRTPRSRSAACADPIQLGFS